MYQVPDHLNQPLYVITPIFNAPRFKARWKHYHRFAKYVKDSGGVLVTIEVAFGDRNHAIPPIFEPSCHPHVSTNGREPIHIQLRSEHELWHKERMINLAMERLPADWKKVAWVDADVSFARPNWVGETIHQLEHYQFVQMFTKAQDLDPNYNPIGSIRSGFVQTVNDGTVPIDPAYYGGRGASGLAWAARRQAIDDIGGLPDFCILGSADWHLAHALFGMAQISMPGTLSSEYRDRIMQVQDRAEKYIRRNVGTVSGLCLHMWHGKKIDRKYTDRWKVLTDNNFRPSIDLKPDWQGLYQLADDGTERSIKLRDDIRRYFRERCEDSIDV